jgi:hypothetical protein
MMEHTASVVIQDHSCGNDPTIVSKTQIDDHLFQSVAGTLLGEVAFSS